MASEKEIFVTKQYIPTGPPISENNHTLIYKVKCVAEKGSPVGILKMYRHKNIKNLYTRLMQLDYSEWPHIYNVKYFDESTLVVEEFLTGCTVAELIARNKRQDTTMSEEQAYDIMDKLSEVIIELLNLEPPIVHHDLRPSNIFITRSGAVKLLDFTPDYSNKKQSPLSRLLHTLGGLFHEMLTGKEPPKGKCIYHGRYTDVIEKCLEKNPEKQYASMEQMKDDLHDAKEADYSGDTDVEKTGIPFWLTMPFQGTILAFEWILIVFFLQTKNSILPLFIIALVIHAAAYFYRRTQFLRKKNVSIGISKTWLPVAALAGIFIVLYFAVSMILPG